MELISLYLHARSVETALFPLSWIKKKPQRCFNFSGSNNPQPDQTFVLECYKSSWEGGNLEIEVWNISADV